MVGDVANAIVSHCLRSRRLVVLLALMALFATWGVGWLSLSWRASPPVMGKESAAAPNIVTASQGPIASRADTTSRGPAATAVILKPPVATTTVVMVPPVATSDDSVYAAALEPMIPNVRDNTTWPTVRLTRAQWTKAIEHLWAPLIALSADALFATTTIRRQRKRDLGSEDTVVVRSDIETTTSRNTARPSVVDDEGQRNTSHVATTGIASPQGDAEMVEAVVTENGGDATYSIVDVASMCKPARDSIPSWKGQATAHWNDTLERLAALGRQAASREQIPIVHVAPDELVVLVDVIVPEYERRMQLEAAGRRLLYAQSSNKDVDVTNMSSYPPLVVITACGNVGPRLRYASLKPADMAGNSTENRALEALWPALRSAVIHRWFTVNCDVDHPKLECVPMGFALGDDLSSGRHPAVSSSRMKSVTEHNAAGSRELTLYVDHAWPEGGLRNLMLAKLREAIARDALDEPNTIVPLVTIGGPGDDVDEAHRRVAFVLVPPNIERGVDSHRVAHVIAEGAIPVLWDPVRFRAWLHSDGRRSAEKAQVSAHSGSTDSAVQNETRTFEGLPVVFAADFACLTRWHLTSWQNSVQRLQKAGRFDPKQRLTNAFWMERVAAQGTQGFVTWSTSLLATPMPVIATTAAASGGAPGASSALVPRLRGVVLFLYGSRWHDYFVRATLPSLAAYFLRCHPYPVHIFHEGVTTAVKDSFRAALTQYGARDPVVDDEDVSDVWASLPPSVSEQDVRHWVSTGGMHPAHGRGYRIMCRFWAGLVWQRPSMDKYDYYWRLGTDSILTRPVSIDVFRHVFVEIGCEYGYNRLTSETGSVVERLWDTFEAWARRDNLSAARWAVVRRFSISNEQNPDPAKQLRTAMTDPRSPTFKEKSGSKHFWAPMFNNNFELGTFRLKRDPLYAAFFKYMDTEPPYGIFRYRWGDAPLHTLGVIAVLSDPVVGVLRNGSLCEVAQQDLGYGHAVEPPPAVVVPTATCVAHPQKHQ